VTRKAKPAGFEATLAELEKLVAQMEAGELPLEDALRNFERGVQLTRECQQELQKAQQKVEILMQRPAGPAVVPFDVADDADE
jgi:exodeoxyribonuclease VII small subunit